jgi:GDP-4-dehydro-6-deoxy-D-mannose reductase
MNNNSILPILVTGGCGMVGSHIVDHYYNKGEMIHATYWAHPTINLEEVKDKAHYHKCDVREADVLLQLIQDIKPTTIYHLAAQSYPTVSWNKPVETMDINVNGTIHVFEAIKTVRQSDPSYDPMVVIACSSAEYGASLTPENTPVKESVQLLPLHPYGVSKVGQDLMGYQYFVNDNIRCIRARIFNTTGPRKVNDVASDFTKRAILWQKGKVDHISIGNITTKRAITDVRDLVSALLLLAEKGVAGETYNISGQKFYEINDIITLIEKRLGASLPTQVDPKLLRPSDEPIIFGDSSKLIAATGWQQQYTLEQTINDMLDYWLEVL